MLSAGAGERERTRQRCVIPVCGTHAGAGERERTMQRSDRVQFYVNLAIDTTEVFYFDLL